MMRRPFFALLVAAAAGMALLLFLFRAPSPPLVQEAFIWQRAWSPALDAAVTGNADIVHRWHVLAAHMEDGTPAAFAVHWSTLLRTGRPVVPVLRIDGPLPENPASILQFLAALPHAARGALEIDYDSPTAALARYAAFLRRLRAVLSPGTALSATMLPDWLNAEDFPAYSQSVDFLVLQVHAVQAPSQGLFDQARALIWSRRASRLSHVPFLVAVPDYALRVTFSKGGTALAAASDMPVPMLAGARTIAAMPEYVADFLALLRRAALTKCTGIVWFRLPLSADGAGNTATWGQATWRQVVLGTPLLPHLAILRAAQPPPAPADIILRNTGNTDILAPQKIPLQACAFFDGIAPYRRAGESLVADQRPWIAPGKTLRAGWARCEAP